MTEKRGKPKKPPPKKRDVLKIPLPFDDAVRAALETPAVEASETVKPKPKRRRGRGT